MTTEAPEGRWPTVAEAIATAIVAVLSVVATLGLHSLTADWAFVVPAVIGSATAAVVAVASRRLALLVGDTLAASVVAFVLVGTIVVGGIPTPSAFTDFFSGLTGAWADLLSVVAPAELTAEMRVAPFALAWFGALVGTGLVRWVRQPGLPVLGPLATLCTTVLLTDEDRTVSIALGAVVVVGALAIGTLQSHGTPAVAHTSAAVDESARRRVRLAKSAAVLALVAVVAPWLGPRLPLAESRDRYDLRDQVVPPWNPLELPSPLVQVKASLAEARQDEPAFTVSSGTPITRWSLAALGAYDGVVWSVASESGDAVDEFRPVGPRLPPPPEQPSDDPTLSATVTVVDVPGPWIPTPGWGTHLEILDDDSDDGTDSDAGADGDGAADGGRPVPVVRENVVTGTLAVPGGLASGTTYEIEALAPPTPDDAALRGLDLGDEVPTADLEALPPQIVNLAADLTEGIEPGWGRVTAVRDQLTSTGFYDTSARTSPGHSYFRLAQFLADPEQIVGYEEQYAAAAALVTRIVGLPSRVVVGYVIEPDRYVDGTAEVLAGDMSAWIEVRVDDIGWVPVDVTPPRSREPNTENAVAPREQVATPNPPPPPQNPPDIDVISDNRETEEPVEEEDDEEDDEEQEAAGGGIGWVGWTLVGAGSAFGLFLLFCAVVIGWKRRRSARRRQAPEPPLRIAGAWRELVDRYDEAGVPIPPEATPLEAARAFIETEPSASEVGPELIHLVATVDRAAYHAVAPSAHDADRAWQCCDEVLTAMLDDRTLPQRTRMRLDPRPLFRPDAWQRSRAATPADDSAGDADETAPATIPVAVPEPSDV